MNLLGFSLLVFQCSQHLFGSKYEVFKRPRYISHPGAAGGEVRFPASVHALTAAPSALSMWLPAAQRAAGRVHGDQRRQQPGDPGTDHRPQQTVHAPGQVPHAAQGAGETHGGTACHVPVTGNPIPCQGNSQSILEARTDQSALHRFLT